MAEHTYRFRREFECWKERTCAYCGCVYRYRLKAARTGTGPTREAAKEDGIIAAMETVSERLDMSPCPRCLSYQPEMIGAQRLQWHAIMMAFAAVWVVPLILVYTGWMSRWLAIAVTFVFAIVMILVHCRMQWRYPRGSKALAAKKLLNDDIRVKAGTERKPESWEKPESIRAGMAVWISLGVAVCSLVLFVASDALLLATGWPTNNVWHPEVGGPGDSMWVFVPSNVKSVKGLWGGQAHAVLHCVDDPNIVIPLDSETRNVGWGDRINLDKGDRNQDSNSPWVGVYIPDDPRLAGKKVRIEITLNMAVPVMAGQNQFVTQWFLIQRTEQATLGPSNCGLIFLVVWYGSMLLPLMCLIGMEGMMILMAIHLRMQPSDAEVKRIDDAGFPAKEESKTIDKPRSRSDVTSCESD